MKLEKLKGLISQKTIKIESRQDCIDLALYCRDKYTTKDFRNLYNKLTNCLEEEEVASIFNDIIPRNMAEVYKKYSKGSLYEKLRRLDRRNFDYSFADKDPLFYIPYGSYSHYHYYPVQVQKSKSKKKNKNKLKKNQKIGKSSNSINDNSGQRIIVNGMLVTTGFYRNSCKSYRDK